MLQNAQQQKVKSNLNSLYGKQSDLEFSHSYPQFMLPSNCCMKFYEIAK